MRLRRRQVYLVMSLLLLVQFGSSPANYLTGSARSIGWAIPHGGLLLAAHISLGLALVVGGIMTIALVASSGSRIANVTSVLGGVSILGAAFNGASFRIF